MRPRPKPILFALILLGICAALPRQGATAEVPDEAYGRVNAALAESYLIPRFRELADSAVSLDEAVRTFCEGDGARSLDEVRASFHDVMDAWIAVQHVTFGPAELFMRGYRIQFWPQARGKFREAVQDMLAGEESALSPGSFRSASVAAQGLPALEELIYGPEADDGLTAKEPGSVTRCDLAKAIAANLKEIAGEMAAAWEGGRNGFARLLSEPGPDNPQFETAQQATLALFKSFYGGLELVHTAKLTPVLGPSAADARPEYAESSLSGRSLRNIILNLESLREMYSGASGSGFGQLVRKRGDEVLDALMLNAFQMTIGTARAVEGPLAAAARSPSDRPRLEQLATQVQALKQIVRVRLADALDLGVGFNALDGD